MQIKSFNMLFSEAKREGYCLDGFYEDAVGFYYARWRKGLKPGPEVKRRLPFNAALGAFLECKRAIGEDEAGGESDLFG